MSIKCSKHWPVCSKCPGNVWCWDEGCDLMILEQLSFLARVVKKTPEALWGPPPQPCSAGASSSHPGSLSHTHPVQTQVADIMSSFQTTLPNRIHCPPLVLLCIFQLKISALLTLEIPGSCHFLLFPGCCCA